MNTLPESTDKPKAAGDDQRPHADDIPWMLRPIARLEECTAKDLLALDGRQLLAYTATVREDARALRLTLHEALALIARQQDQLTRATRVIDFQRQQLRKQQERLAA